MRGWGRWPVQNSFRISTDVDRDLVTGDGGPKLISNFYWCRFGHTNETTTGPKLISNFYWCRYRHRTPPPGVQNSFRISTDVDNVRPRMIWRVQNSIRISTDVDQITNLPEWGPKLISNFYWCRSKSHFGGLPRPKLISNFYWCRFANSTGAYTVQNSFRISTDVDWGIHHHPDRVQNSFRISTDVDRPYATSITSSKTHFEFLLM